MTVRMARLSFMVAAAFIGVSSFAAAQLPSAFQTPGNKSKANEAQVWLERMANDGMPNYELIAADPSLANARAAPAFGAFLARERARNDEFRA